MPTIECSKKDLERLIGKKLSPKQLEDAVLFAKGELDSVDGNNLKIDIKDTNRPDLWSTEGIARELRARLGVKTGLPKIKTTKGKVELIIEKSVKKSRPYIMGAVVKGVKVNNDFIVQMVQLQEKVGMTFGRKRKELGIGLYDFDIMTPPIFYRGYKPHELKFAPLDFTREMDLDEIVAVHPKGKEYGHLVSTFDRYPIVEDAKGVVCSMPPIINSNDTGKITAKTKNVFVECTGWNQDTVKSGLNVIVAALADRGGKVEQIKVKDGNKTYWSPDFTPKKITISTDYVRKIAGMNWRDKEIIRLLKRGGYDVKGAGKKLTVYYPAYRHDIFHPVDVIEDIIISYGYNNLEVQEIDMSVKGEILQNSVYVDTVRDCCVGLGFQEILTFILSSKDSQGRKMRLSTQEFAEIANPVSSNWEVFRTNIIPGLLEFMAKNMHVSFPHKLFETGKVVTLNKKSETGVDEPNRLSIMIAHDKTNYTEIKSAVDSVAKNMGWKITTHAFKHPSFVEGRTAIVKGDVHGVVGELHPDVLKNFGIDVKVSACGIEY